MTREAGYKWRLKAERYRAFAAIAGDSGAQKARLCRAQHYDRLADAIEGRVPAPDPDFPPVAPFEALRRALKRLAAVAS